MKIKRLLFALLMCLSLISCSQKEKKEITCQDVINCYEELGYDVFHNENSIEEDYQCFVRVASSDREEFIFFHFYENEDAAKKAAKENKYSIVSYFLSIIYQDPTWIHIISYQNIMIEYEHKELYKPFLDLTR